MTRAVTLALALCAGAGCAPRGSLLPDYAEMMAVGVEPSVEAERVEGTLGAAGFTEDERVEGEGFVALGFGRASDGRRAVRVVTTRGVAFALDSDPRDAAAPAGSVHVETEASGTDVDGDGRRDVVVARTEGARTCLLVMALTDDGGLEALRVDAADLPANVCLEGFEDVDGRGSPEAIVRVRAPRLARTATPTADIALERDEGAIYRRVPPAVSYLARTRADLAEAQAAAAAARDEETSYTLAVQAALVAWAAGESPELQLEAFDAGVTSVVWSPELARAVLEARESIAHGWR